MKRMAKTFVTAAFLTAVFSTAAFAQSWCNPLATWYYHFDGSYAPYSYEPCHGWSGTGHVIGANMYFNQSARDSIQNYVRQGERYSHDYTDTSNLLSATGTYATNLPGPYIDFDDDNGNGRWEEAEVTAEDTSFPVTYRKYWVQFWFRFYGNSSSTGYIYHTPAISEQLWYTSDKWDTDWYSNPFVQRYKQAGNLVEEWLKGNEKEAATETVKLSEPTSVEEFTNRINRDGTRVLGTTMEYEIDTEDGPQVLTVGLASKENELFPTADLQEVLGSIPSTFKITGFRGVVSYRIESVDQKADQQDK